MRKRFIARDIDGLLRIVCKDGSIRFQIQSYEIECFRSVKTFYRYMFFSLKADFLMYENFSEIQIIYYLLYI